MDRRRFLNDSTIGLTGLYLASMALSSCSKKTSFDMLKAIPESSPYKMKHLRGNVGYFSEKGGTIVWMIEGRNTVIVDTQFPEQATNLMKECQKLTDEKIEYVFNTHHHGDHTSGNVALKPFTQHFVAHENSIANQKRAAEQKNELDKIVLPEISFEEGYQVKVGKETITCKYFGPAHTNGDSVVHFEQSNVAHIGDLVFNRRFPYIDKNSGANIQSWISVNEAILKHYDDETIFICGHAAADFPVVIGKEDIRAKINYLERLLEFGHKCIAEGRTAEEVKSSTTVIPGAEQWKGDGIGRSIDAVYLEITSGK